MRSRYEYVWEDENSGEIMEVVGPAAGSARVGQVVVGQRLPFCFLGSGGGGVKEKRKGGRTRTK